MQWLDSLPINLLGKNLDGLWGRQQAISDNLANVETPGYKAKTVSFEEQLKKELTASVSTEGEMIDRIKNTGATVSVNEDQVFRLDGNGVDLEKENVELARTQLNYYSSLQLISDTFSRLRTVINAKD